jgi:hypothetical protein
VAEKLIVNGEMRRLPMRAMLVGGVFAAIGPTGPASAQQAEAPDERDEIVVTAMRGERRLIDVPADVTVKDVKWAIGACTGLSIYGTYVDRRSETPSVFALDAAARPINVFGGRRAFNG